MAEVAGIAAPASSQSSQDGKLTELIDKLRTRIEQGEDVSVDLVRKVAGRRAAGPVLLIPALVVISPLSIIPGLPTMVGLNTILVAGQIALGREDLWLPRWLANRCIPSKYGEKLLRFLSPAGRVVDKVAKPRASATAGPLFRRLGAIVCILVGCVMPIMEVVPFTSTWGASIIALYALAITVRDGLLALAWIAFVLAILSIGWMILF
ncbi:Uncharacterized conserved protein [Devosia crocina]|uniref:Uncharacterized conserved protein n=1 Tax=Devosia crocina TaxID=429728 RepID=A0A1I7N1H1_9HYPH|nr:exopolysaccharide biosynthesis protein [Devosia crocina]SFV28484.1 Uncharacterized conserved protein [Devosia crocina]